MEVRPIVERGVFVGFTQEWTEWFSGRQHWCNFHLIELSYEDEICMGQREIVFFVLGFGLTVQWCYNAEADGLRLVEERMNEIRVHRDAAVPLEDILKAVIKEKDDEDRSAR